LRGHSDQKKKTGNPTTGCGAAGRRSHEHQKREEQTERLVFRGGWLQLVRRTVPGIKPKRRGRTRVVRGNSGDVRTNSQRARKKAGPTSSDLKKGSRPENRKATGKDG